MRGSKAEASDSFGEAKAIEDAKVRLEAALDAALQVIRELTDQLTRLRGERAGAGGTEEGLAIGCHALAAMLKRVALQRGVEESLGVDETDPEGEPALAAPNLPEPQLPEETKQVADGDRETEDMHQAERDGSKEGTWSAETSDLRNRACSLVAELGSILGDMETANRFGAPIDESADDSDAVGPHQNQSREAEVDHEDGSTTASAQSRSAIDGIESAPEIDSSDPVRKRPQSVGHSRARHIKSPREPRQELRKLSNTSVSDKIWAYIARQTEGQQDRGVDIITVDDSDDCSAAVGGGAARERKRLRLATDHDGLALAKPQPPG